MFLAVCFSLSGKFPPNCFTFPDTQPPANVIRYVWVVEMTTLCRTPIEIRLVMALPDAETHDLIESLLQAAMALVPLNVKVTRVWSRKELLHRVRAQCDDLILLDWQVAEADTPDLVREIVALNPKLRMLVLLPLQLRQYRQTLWEAGVCSSIPKEHLEAEWLSSALCLISRAMEREQRARLALAI
jgi:CheY-like chemotaxis protein